MLIPIRQKTLNLKWEIARGPTLYLVNTRKWVYFIGQYQHKKKSYKQKILRSTQDSNSQKYERKLLLTSSAGEDDPLLWFLTSWLAILLVWTCDLFSLLADCTGDLVCWFEDRFAMGLDASSGDDRCGLPGFFFESAAKNKKDLFYVLVKQT